MLTSLTNEQLDALTDQALVDYLCTAVEELDVLYVEIWLRRLKGRGVKDAVTRKHSSSNMSALARAGRAQQGVLAELVLHLLLFRLPSSPKDAWNETAYLALGFREWAVAAALYRHVFDSASPAYLDACEVFTCANQAAVATVLDSWLARGKLPQPPASDALTGCKPLPAPPTPASPHPSTTLLDYPIPPAPSTSSAPSTASASSSSSSFSPSTRLRLSPIPPGASVEMLTKRLPLLQGLRKVELNGEDAAVLSFGSQVEAERARGEILRSYGGRTPLNVVFFSGINSSAPLPPARLAGEPAISAASTEPTPPTSVPPTAPAPPPLVAPPRPLAHPKAPPPFFPPDHPIRLRLSNLPPHTQPLAILSFLYTNGVAADPYSLTLTPIWDAYLTVPHRAAYELALSRLDNQFFPGSTRRIVVDRDRPDYGASAAQKTAHPTVLVAGLSGRATKADVERLGQRAKCGVYDARIKSSPADVGGREGSFRTSSPFAAERAVEVLDGLMLGGAKLSAWWLSAEEAAAMEAVVRDTGIKPSPFSVAGSVPPGPSSSSFAPRSLPAPSVFAPSASLNAFPTAGGPARPPPMRKKVPTAPRRKQKQTATFRCRGTPHHHHQQQQSHALQAPAAAGPPRPAATASHHLPPRQLVAPTSALPPAPPSQPTPSSGAVALARSSGVKRRFEPSASYAQQQRSRLDALTDQELVDYLCTAVEELDVLYVEIWLRRLKDRGVKDTVTRKHSWKRECALALAGRAEQSPLAALVLHLLLLRLPRSHNNRWPPPEISEFGFKPWAWTVTRRQHGHGLKNPLFLTAHELYLCTSPDDVAARLDEWEQSRRLSSPANPESFTGCSPLPGPPLPPTLSTSRTQPGGHPIRFPADHPIRLQLLDVPPGLNGTDLNLLLLTSSIPFDSASVSFGSADDAYFIVPNRAAYELALERLDGSAFYPGTATRVSIDRDRPDRAATDEEQASHPMVILSGLKSHTSANDVGRLARSTRCGSYNPRAFDVRVRDRTVNGEGSIGDRGPTRAAEGSFRTSSPAAAERAVKLLDGATVGFRRIEARWVHMGSAAMEKRKKAEEELNGEKEMDLAQSSDEDSPVRAVVPAPLSSASVRLVRPHLNSHKAPPLQLPSPEPSLDFSPFSPSRTFTLPSSLHRSDTSLFHLSSPAQAESADPCSGVWRGRTLEPSKLSSSSSSPASSSASSSAAFIAPPAIAPTAHKRPAPSMAASLVGGNLEFEGAKKQKTGLAE